MKVFISWSGQRSRAVAELLNSWIRCVLLATRPWLSTRDIERGALWFSEINDQLQDTSVGIVCLTQSNRTKPWILFEAGALAKGLSSSRVCTFLIDLRPSDLKDPLAQFNHTLPERESVWELVRTLNNCLGESTLDERILQQVFDTYWPQFEASFTEILAEPETETIAHEPRNNEDMLAEILELTRSNQSRLLKLETGKQEPELTPSQRNAARFTETANENMRRALQKHLESARKEWIQEPGGQKLDNEDVKIELTPELAKKIRDFTS